MSKKLLSLLLISGLTTGVGVSTAFATTEPVYAATTADAQYTANVQTILNNINKERANVGLPALALDSQMGTVALNAAKTQASNNALGGDPNASSLIPKDWYSFGQVVAMGYTPATVTSGLMNSTNAKNHMLSQDHTRVGIGIAYNSAGKAYYTEIFAGYPNTDSNYAVYTTTPQNLTRTALSQTAFTITWTKPTKVIGTLKNYTVQVTGTNYSKSFTTTSLKQTVTGLPENTSYSVTVTANAVSADAKYTKSSTARITVKTVKTLTSADVQRILDDTNAERAKVGAPPLKLRSDINTVAQNWTNVMAKENNRYHNPNLSAQLPAGWKMSGENIANGFSVETVVRAWYDSKPHRDNMLNPNFTHIGIGLAYNSNGQLFYTQDFAKY